MSGPRKTVEVDYLLRKINFLLRSPGTSPEGRRDLIYLLEDVLLKSGRSTWHYFLGPDGKKIFTERDAPDPTRRQYSGGPGRR